MVVTLMLFVRLPKVYTSAHVKQALKVMDNTAEVMCHFCFMYTGYIYIHILPCDDEV